MRKEEYYDLIDRRPLEEFDGEFWESGASCWQFAIGLNTDETLLIGDIIDRRVTASQIRQNGSYILKSVISAELEFLGFMSEETVDAYDLPEDALFKLAFLIDSDQKYHVIKMFPDGSWWRKWAGVQPTDIGAVTGRKIVSPLYECFEDHEVFFVDVYPEF